MCEGWSQLSCLGMKEGVGVMEGKEFVCHFCMSGCLLTLQKEVVGLREELWSAESGNEVAKEIIRAVYREDGIWVFDN